MSRKAASKNILEAIKNSYVNSGFVQDAAETLLGAGIGAGYQAMFTDMTPEEIAISTTLGIGGAMAARPVMGTVGYAMGRQGDRMFPKAADNMPGIAKLIPGTPQSVQAMEGNELVQDLFRAKYNQNFRKKDGSERGFLEGTTGLIARQYGDNVAQLGIAMATPAIFDNIRPDERKAREVAKLEQALAELKGEVPSAITQ
jgi:hypothetical protein